MNARATVKAHNFIAKPMVAQSLAHLADLQEMAGGVLGVVLTRQPEVNDHAQKV
jgi:hypothetical protein